MSYFILYSLPMRPFFKFKDPWKYIHLKFLNSCVYPGQSVSEVFSRYYRYFVENVFVLFAGTEIYSLAVVFNIIYYNYYLFSAILLHMIRIGLFFFNDMHNPLLPFPQKWQNMVFGLKRYASFWNLETETYEKTNFRFFKSYSFKKKFNLISWDLKDFSTKMLNKNMFSDLYFSSCRENSATIGAIWVSTKMTKTRRSRIEKFEIRFCIGFRALRVHLLG